MPSITQRIDSAYQDKINEPTYHNKSGIGEKLVHTYNMPNGSSFITTQKDQSDPCINYSGSTRDAPITGHQGKHLVKINSGHIDKFLTLINKYINKDGSKTQKKHLLKIKEDIRKNPVIRQYLILNEEKSNASLEWNKKPETSDDLQRLIDAFRTRHDRKGSLNKLFLELLFSGEIKSAVQEDNSPPTLAQFVPYTSQDVKFVSRQIPVAHTSTVSDTAHEAQKLNDDYPTEKNPFTDVSAVPDDESPTLIKVSQEKEYLHLDNLIFLELLNKYLITIDGQALGEINKKHVTKIKEDIKESAVVARYLTLNNEKTSLTWKAEPSTRNELQQLLDAFKTRHNSKGSFYKLLSNSTFVERGYRLIKETTHSKIINTAAEPAIHRLDKSKIVDMKRKVMLDVVTHFSSPERHKEPLSETVLEPLISYYGQVEQTVESAQRSTGKLASGNKISLEDKSFWNTIKRLFHQIKTDDRVEQFKHAVTNNALKFQEKMKKELDYIQDQRAPEQVAQQVKESVNKRLKKAYDRYANEMRGTNIYPAKLSNDSVTFKQIDNVAIKNFRIGLKEIVLRYERVFIDNLRKGIISFSADIYFQGKSRERAFDNIIKINNAISSSYEVAKEQHENNISILTSKNKEHGNYLSPELAAEFEGMKNHLVDDIKKKIMENYQAGFNLYNKDVNSLTSLKLKSGYSDDMKKVKTLNTLSEQLVADVDKIHKNQFNRDLNINPITLRNEVNSMAKPVMENIITRLPRIKSIGETLKSAFSRAFKPTPAKILGSIPLVGGLAFSLAALPTAIAIPVGIAAAVVLPVALLAWVGFNIHKRFSQRSEIIRLSQQIEKHLQKNIV